ncbi:MAG: hypothetical protein V2I54_11940 [Bacteroidales bacterium]|jgi:hypothetical protein|nr:hypothetical protein [Bacteroidales bacterium]
MLKEKIEQLFFQNKTKDQLIEEALTSLSALIGNALTGDDVNQLKPILPPKLQPEDIGVKLKTVCIHLENNEHETPCAEVSIDLIIERTGEEMGVYSLFYNEQGEQIDEVLNLY